jgi:hypothetical protein
VSKFSGASCLDSLLHISSWISPSAHVPFYGVLQKQVSRLMLFYKRLIFSKWVLVASISIRTSRNVTSITFLGRLS